MYQQSVAVVLMSVFALFVAQESVTQAQPKKPTDTPKKKITYDDHIKPILRAKCFGCHNQNKKEGNLDMTSYTGIRAGGGSGEVIEPGELDGSYLWSLITHESQPFMPPKQRKLPKQTIDLIGAWISGGALENSGGKFVRKRPTFDLTLKEAPTERPKVMPLPTRLPLQPVVKTTLTTAISALATSPWAPLTAVAGQEQVLLYNTQTMQLVGVLPFPEGTAHVLKFSRNGSLLLAGGGRPAYKGLVVVWNVKTGERVFEIGDELDTVLGADISSDHSMIALGSSAKVVRVYSTKDGSLLYQIPKKHTNWLYCLEFSPDGVLLATADRAGGLFVWEAETGHEYLRLAGHGGAIRGLTWRTDSNILASCGRDGAVRLWEMENGRQVKNWTAHGGGAESVEFCRDGNLVTCGRDKVTKLWKQDGGQIRAFSAFTEMALNVTYCDESKRLVAGDWTGATKVWNAADGKDLGMLSANPPKLEERLTAATTALAARQADYKKLADAYQVAQAAATKVTTDLAAAQKNVTAVQTRLQTATAAVATGKKSVTDLTTAVGTATKAAAALAPVVPLLKETADKGQLTAAKAPADKELAAAVAQLKAVLTKRTADLAATRKAVTDKTAALNTAKQQLATAEKQVVDATTALAAAQKQVTTLTAAVKPATDKATAAKQAADTSNATLVAAQKEIERWKAEIDFSQKLTVLIKLEDDYGQLAAVFSAAQAEVGKMNTQLAAANTAVANTQKQFVAATAVVNKEKQSVASATAEHAAVTKATTALAAALPILKDALAKGQEVVAKLPGDKELAAAAAQLKTLVDKKTAELANLKKTLAEKAVVLTKSQQALAAAEKQVATVAATMVAAKKQVADLTTSAKPLQDKAAAAKKAVDAALQALQAARKAVDLLRVKPVVTTASAAPTT